LRAGRLAKFALASIVAVYVGWWAVRSAVVSSSHENPFLGARIASSDPQVRIGMAMLFFQLRGGDVPESQQRAARDALKDAPLADAPFLIAGVNALAHGRTAEGERLLLEARHRNPRLRMARLLLLDLYLKQKRVEEAAVEMGSISSLVTGADSALTPYLAKMAQDPTTAPTMIPMLRRQPSLRDGVLQAMAAMGAEPAQILSVAGNSLRPSPNPPQWQHSLLEQLIAKGRQAEALSLWRQFAGQPEGSPEKGLYDAQFVGLPGPTPFNWSLADGGPGVAERVRGKALSADYYGRADGDLASQLLMLRPGRYRFSFRASGDAAGTSSKFVWTVTCGDAALVQIPITGAASAPKSFAGAFAVPAGCPVQWLKLRGVTGDIENPQSAVFTALSLLPEGAR
jgi:hypothetical protein